MILTLYFTYLVGIIKLKTGGLRKGVNQHTSHGCYTLALIPKSTKSENVITTQCGLVHSRSKPSN